MTRNEKLPFCAINDGTAMYSKCILNVEHAVKDIFLGSVAPFRSKTDKLPTKNCPSFWTEGHTSSKHYQHWVCFTATPTWDFPTASTTILKVDHGQTQIVSIGADLQSDDKLQATCVHS